MSEIITREAVESDIGAVAALWREVLDFHSGRDTHYKRSEDALLQFSQFFSTHIESDSSLCPVAEAGGEVVGYGLAVIAERPPVFDEREYGMIYDLGVTGVCRRKGIGEKMFNYINKWYKSRGIRRIELRVAIKNEVA